MVMSCLVLLSTHMFGAAEEGTNAVDSPYPLMAWDYADSEQTLRLMSECGINMVAFVPADMLDACERLGLKAIVFDESVSGENWQKPFDAEAAIAGLRELIPRVNGHPAVAGYHLKDEPHPSELPALGRASAVVRELAPGKWPYINLLPICLEDYDDYLNGFVEHCKPMYLSYDCYVLPESGGFGAHFWTHLAKYRAKSLETGIPFFNIVLTAAHWAYREVTEVDIRLQTYGSLVYGARGIAYYKFNSRSLPILEAPDLGNFRMGPLDQFGEKTPTWHWLRNTNRQILNLGPTMLQLRSDDVYHLGDLPEDQHGPSATSLVRGLPDGPWVVGDFTHEDGSRYCMIVNKSLERSAPCTPEFTKKRVATEYISAFTGERATFPAPYFHLAPGQGVLLRITWEEGS